MLDTQPHFRSKSHVSFLSLKLLMSGYSSALLPKWLPSFRLPAELGTGKTSRGFNCTETWEWSEREKNKPATFVFLRHHTKCASDISNNNNLKKAQCNISSPEKSKLYWNNSSKLRALFRSSRTSTVVVIMFIPLRRCKHWVNLCKHYHILIKILHRLWWL